ncbi:NADH dehydrogenase subunit 11 (mitochondrion) [Nannochloropsis oceanica]|uniref:NADH dehydrogenase subunit 11 n=1 Tax=Nannochloropsis oceanica TaxID=145522 RepID=T1R7J1_9STRA|nr:NADH dehydrogenase subunit 11 [Nannochloropsis oceanica]AHX24966.1 NADH dehydrogenase subunit 11 [Nannochloropsis oceanica]
MLLLTGALTSKPYAFTSRPWELRSVQSIDTLDGIGSNIRIDFKESEVLRILPRKNPEINENWISDRIRFFYDGLKRQRLTSPFVKKSGELRPVKWKKTVSKLSSLLKVYSFEYGPSKVGFLASSNLDLETIYVLRNFSHNYGFSFLGIDKTLKINIDNTTNYKFQNNISEFEKTDFCLFIGTNPRFEASTLNLRLRKIFRKGNTSFASIGGNFSSTFPINFLGLSPKTLVSIAEGKHPICKSLAQAKNPTIILGSKLCERNDGFAIQDLIKELVHSFYTIFDKKLAVNLLHTEANTVGSFELGIKSFVKSDLAKCKILYTVGIDEPSFFDNNLKTNSSSVLIMQSSHGDKNTNKADFVLPSYTFVEKTGIYYNTEGRPQKTQRALIGPNLSREDWKIFQILFYSLDKLSSFETKSQLITEMSKILPSSYFANSWFRADFRTGQPTLFEFGSKNLGKIYKTSFKLFIEDFYMTSNLCQSSKIMAKASNLLRSYSNNYKFLTWASINK